DVHFGGGADTLALSGDAVQTGRVIFGSASDVLSLAGSSKFDGIVDFGGGADRLNIGGSAIFAGTLLNAGSTAVDVASGVLNIAAPVSLGSLSVGADGVLVATLDKAAGEGAPATVAS